MIIQAYIYHKRAEKYSDCQDYFGINIKNNRIAVSDGMSQSIYPQWWAEILVNAYLANGKIPSYPDELQKFQKDWQDKVQGEILNREKHGKNPWRLINSYTEKSGAGATLCGLTWNENKWTCECIGDSSLILVRSDFSIEIKSSQEGEYSNHPDYIDSFQKGRGNVRYFNGSFNDLYTILLVTDPFSDLFYRHRLDSEFISARINEIKALSDHNSYSELVEKWRDEFEMHNDDSTIIILTDFSTPELQPIHIDHLEKLCSNEKIDIEKDIEKNKSDKSNCHTHVTNAQITNVSEQPDSISNDSCKTSLKIDEESVVAKQNFIAATKHVLRYYDKKRSKNKILKWLQDLMSPIISDFCLKK